MKEFYSYVNSVVIGGTNPQEKTDTIKIGADADFIIKKISISATNDKATIFIKDTSSTKEWFSEPIEIRNLAGNYGANSRPNVLFAPKRVRANNTITIIYRNEGTAENKIQFVIEGYREKPKSF